MKTPTDPNCLSTPTRERIEAARLEAGITQQQAAELVHRKDSARWREWASGRHAMDLAVWELFLIKTGQRKVQRKPSKTDKGAPHG